MIERPHEARGRKDRVLHKSDGNVSVLFVCSLDKIAVASWVRNFLPPRCNLILKAKRRAFERDLIIPIEGLNKLVCADERNRLRLRP